MKPLKIVFMGTPDFAVPALEALHESNHRAELVVTQPDRRKGRGRKLAPPPVKAAALEMGYEVVQPESIKTVEFADRMKSVAPDLYVVVAYGHILTREILDIPKKGAVNIHASILPKYRGAAPIQRAVISGEKETGVTIMYLDEGMDTGDILAVEKTEISNRDTAGTLHDRLAVVGAKLLISTLDELAEGTAGPLPQDHSLATYAPPLKKDDGRIDWKKPAEEIETLIRGVTPWPGAFTFHGEKRLKIFRAKVLHSDAGAPAGTVVRGFDGELRVAAGEGCLGIEEIQGPSGKRLPIEDFLRGYPLTHGESLS